MKTIKNFIANRFVEPTTNEYFIKDDPSTGKPSIKVARSNFADVNKAIEAASVASKEWANVSQAARCDILNQIAQKIESRFDEFAALECEDTGKPLKLCKDLDIPRAIHNFKFFSDFAGKSEPSAYDMSAATSYALRFPLGIVGLITPWNLPIYLLTWKLAPALAAGNAVIAKPSELTPQTANLLAEVLLECDLPSGLVNIIHGPGREAAEPILTSPKIKAISFTGGTSTGKRIIELASQDFKKVSLELGGKNPTIVFADANLQEAAAGVARSSFLNQGQICLCGERILIEKTIYDKFKKLLLEETKKLRPNVPSLADTNYGALISKSHLEKVAQYVELAKQEGGIILYGGKKVDHLSGFFFEPTIIEGLDHNCRTVKEEIFGPVVTLHPFETEAQAIELGNSVEYGLSASCWTQDTKRAHRLGEQIEAGTIWINTWLMRDLRAPFGGMKKSGLGREGGSHSLDFFSEYKTLCIKKDVL